MGFKRLGLVLSVGIGTIALLLLLGLLSRPSTVVSARLALPQPGAAEGTASSLTHAATVHYVTITGTDSGDCSTPAGACRTIQYAVDVAGDGGLIKIATGVYTDVHSRDGITQVVYISKSVSLEGGYTPAFDTGPDAIARLTTLDAQGRGRVVYIGGDTAVSLTGLHITGGDATGDYRWPNRGVGGGVYAMRATVTISASRVFSNTGSRPANGRGGGLFIMSSEFNILDNQILSNTALINAGLGFSGSGGGVAIEDSSGQFVNNLVEGNVATVRGGGNGGGITLRTGPGDRVTFHGNVVQKNMASASDADAYVGYGGGIYILAAEGPAEPEADVRISDNLLQGNIAAVTGLGIGGGLVALTDGSTTMTLAFLNNLVLSNTATVSGFYGGVGGGVAIGTAHVDFEDNRFLGNSAGSGSAVAFDDSDVTASNLVVIDNRATNAGAAVLLHSSNVRLLHPTLARNSGGSGIHVEQGARSQVALTNAILVSHTVGITVAAGHTATLEGILWHSNTINAGGEGYIAVTKAYTGDPAFDSDGYHLLGGSAAIDIGLDVGVNHDIDGESRPVDGNGDGVAAFDVGADEYTGRFFYLYLPAVLRNY